MTDAELNNLETAAKFAAPGPWREEELYPDRSVGPMQVIASNDRVVADCGYSTDSFYIAAANPTTIQELIAELRARTALLEEVYSELGEKINGACNVCSTYTHKHWCYYPELAKILGKPLDEFDTKFLAKIHRRDRG